MYLEDGCLTLQHPEVREALLRAEGFPIIFPHHVSCCGDGWLAGTESRRTQMVKAMNLGEL